MSRAVGTLIAVLVVVSVVAGVAGSEEAYADGGFAESTLFSPEGLAASTCKLSSKYSAGASKATEMYCINSIVIFVHGVNTSASVYNDWIQYFFKSGKFPELSGTLFVSLNWEKDKITQASDQVGGRANSATGMSDRAWFAVWKLGQTVARMQKRFPGVPITIVSHSHGTIVTLAALQEGMWVTNWILMGSPLDAEIVAHCEEGENTFLEYAARNVAGSVWNLWSTEDDVAELKGGIGRFGLKTPCFAGGGWYGNNVYDLHIPGIDHFGDNSWWDAAHLVSKMPPKALDSLKYLLSGNGAKPIGFLREDIDGLNKIDFPWAVRSPEMRTGQNAYRTWDFQDNDYDSIYLDLLLPQGLLTGWYMDDKDRGHYAVQCTKGSANVRIQEAVWSTFNDGENWIWAQEGKLVERKKWNVDGMYDATLWVQIQNLQPGIAECTLFFEAWDD